jgi:hypothetical protein
MRVCVCVCVCVWSHLSSSVFLILFCNLYIQPTVQKVILSAVPISPSWICNTGGGSHDGLSDPLTESETSSQLCVNAYLTRIWRTSPRGMKKIACAVLQPYQRATFDGAIRVRSSCPCPEMKVYRRSRGTVPLILKVGTRLKRVVNFIQTVAVVPSGKNTRRRCLWLHYIGHDTLHTLYLDEISVDLVHRGRCLFTYFREQYTRLWACTGEDSLSYVFGVTVMWAYVFQL